MFVIVRRVALVLFVIGSAAVAGCSGGGFLPLAGGPHSMDSSRLDAIVAAQSKTYDVPQSLVHAVIAQESGGDPSAVSSAGAMGLMQLMPGTAATYGVVNAFDPAANVAGGVAYLHDLLQRYHGDVSLALAAYNAGSGAVAKYGGVPPYAETRAYVNSINAMYRSSPRR